MSVALDSKRVGLCLVMSFESSESGRPVAGILTGNRRLTADKPSAVELEEREEKVVNMSSSSSIGSNSDSSEGNGDSGEGEVQSSYQGPLSTLESLEEVLPIKRGISKFYGGKSKSFTSLADAVSYSSIKEIVKPEDAYTRKRKNLLAHSTFWDKNGLYPPKSNSGGMSKRPANSRSTRALTAIYESNSSKESNLISSAVTLRRPPMHPQGRKSPGSESSTVAPHRNFSPFRSFSLSDLAGAASTIPRITGLKMVCEDKDEVQ